MMTESEFALLCRHLALTLEATKIVHKIRTSPHTNRDQGSSQWTVGRYLSHKMERIIRCESRVESLLIDKLERDSKTTRSEIFRPPSNPCWQLNLVPAELKVTRACS